MKNILNRRKHAYLNISSRASVTMAQSSSWKWIPYSSFTCKDYVSCV